MSIPLTIARTFQIGNKTFAENRAVADELAILAEPPLNPSKSGTVSTRTDATSGELTLEASHGVTTGSRLDIYWTGGSRYGVVVGTVDVLDVPFSLGAGDDLPTQGTEITACVPIEREVVVDGDQVSALLYTCDEDRTIAVLAEADDTEIFKIERPAASPFEWFDDSLVAAPLAGESVAKVFISRQGAAGTVRGRVGLLYS